MLFAKLHIKIKTILIMQSIAMLSGMTTHLIWIINNGFLSENYNAPFFTRFFLDSLTFIDPIAAILLIIKPKTGIWLTFVIIIIDVVHNFIVCFRSITPNSNYFSYWIIGNWMLMCQVFFLLFVSVTFKSNLKEVKIRSAES